MTASVSFYGNGPLFGTAPRNPLLKSYSLKVNANIQPDAFETRLKSWIEANQLSNDIKGVENLSERLFLFRATPQGFKKLWQAFNHELTWVEELPKRKLS